MEHRDHDNKLFNLIKNKSVRICQISVIIVLKYRKLKTLINKNLRINELSKLNINNTSRYNPNYFWITQSDVSV